MDHERSFINKIIVIYFIGILIGTSFPIVNSDPTDVIDQQQTKWNNDITVYAHRWGAQSFKPTVTSLTRAEVYIRKAGSPPSDVVLSVRSSLIGADLVSLAKPASEIPTSNGWVEFDFNDLSVTPSNTYYLVLRTTDGTSTNCYYWGYGSNTPYTNGALQFSTTSGGSWVEFPWYDFCFKTYGTSGPSVPELSYNPSSYDFGSVLPGATGSTTFEIWNSGTGALTYSLSESASWVTVVPTSGDSTGEHDTITVSIDTSGLASGSYNCPVSISSDGGSGTFTVYMTVSEQTDVLDQQQTKWNNDITVYANRWGGQAFKPTVTSLTRMEVFIRKIGTPPSNVVVAIRNSLTEVDLVSLSKPASQIPTSNGWVEFDISDLPVTPGNTYYFVLRSSGGTISNCYTWGYGSTTPYTNGALWFSTTTGGSWSEFPWYDFCFKTYGMSGPSPPMLSYNPSSYDFGSMTAGTTGSTSFEIWNSGTETLTYSLSESASWVTVVPTSGDSTGEHDTITVSIDTSGLVPGSYNCPIGISSNGGSGTFTVYVTIRANLPPVFGTPSPANSSTGQPLSLSWSIPINDPDGNPFSWTIQCSNGQSNSASGASNGTKTCALSGLSYLTTYTVWVNATDPAGSGLYTRRWFRFTTKASNSPPIFGTPSPANGSTGNLLSLSWSIPITDPDGNPFSWTIQCSNGQSNGASGASNGTKALSLTGLANSTTYKIWVNATDPSPGSGLHTRRWFTFTTKQGNDPPVLGSPSPANGSTGNWFNPPPYGPWIPWNIPISDPEGNRFSWTIQCSNGQTASGTKAFNGSMYLAISQLSYSTTYKIWVNATDSTGSGQYTRGIYTFTTRRNGNNPPIFTRAPSPANGSIGTPLTLSWGIRINDLEGNNFSWTIQCSNGQGNNSTGLEKNGTKRLELSGLSYQTTYTIWVNATDPSPGSGLWARKWFTFTTKANNPPVVGIPSPPNGCIGNSLNFIWKIPINETEGEVFSWSIQCSNGQSISDSGASNGTKSLSLASLAYSTTYNVWVNATDPTGSGQYTRLLFVFTTQAPGSNTPPVFTTPSPVNGSSGRRLNIPWSITINDPEGTTFSWTIQCSNGQNISGTEASNGIKTLQLSNLSYLTSYKIWVNATDPTGSGLFTRKWYRFTTEAIIPFNIPTTPKYVITSSAGENRVNPGIADLNNDGIMEIIRTGTNGIVVYNGVNGNVLWSKLESMPNNHYPVEIIDLNKDGILEIISSYGTGTRALHGNNGNVYWYNPNARLDDHHPVVGDINADGYPEVFVCRSGTQNGSSQGRVTALTYNGIIFAQTPTYYPCYGGLSLGDTNNDGVYELFLGERNIGYNGNVVGKGVRAFWASNLTERWCHPETLASSNCPTLVDTNKDGILEVVALAQTGGNGIAVYNSANGNIIHYSSIPGLRCHSNPTVFDIDGDGNLEIIVGGGSDSWSKPLIWDLYTWTFEAWLPFECWEPPAIVDLNGDGRVEILVCTFENISIFDDNYVFRGSIPLSNNYGENGYYGMSMIVAQDIDNDNSLELVINRFNQIYAYDTNGQAPTPRALTQFMYYSPHRGRSPYFTDY